jgi:hypothetical protein
VASDARKLLDRSAERFRTLATELGAEAWTARHPQRGGWSVSEVTEHVTIAARSIATVLEKRLTPLAQPPALEDDEIPFVFYRGDEPPGIGTPSGTWTDSGQAILDFDAAIDAVARAAAAHSDLRALGSAHPSFGTLDGEQWLLFVGAHTERHRAELFGLRDAL